MPVQSADSTDSIDEKSYRVNQLSGNSLGLSIITLRKNMKLGLRNLPPGEPIRAACVLLLYLTFVSGLTVLLPLGGNNSRLVYFRQMGKIPLLVRFQLLVFLAVGIYISIKLFIS